VPVLRSAATAATDVACHVVGRQQVVRAARFTLMRARLDVPNDRNSNGESSLAGWILRLASPGGALHVIDVGANKGQWAGVMLAAARQAGRLNDLDLHSFEPSSDTFACLSQALRGQGVTLNRAALSDREGSATLHVVGPGAATNSLHLPTDAPEGMSTEEVPVLTLDAYAKQAGLDRVALLKIDAEGHDLAVIRGAQGLMAEQRVLIVQFEYNHRWIYGRFFLRDVFELLAPLRYAVGKLTPYGVEFYPRWDADLETFVEGNYIACTRDIADRLPSVKWWKAAGEASR
jgi:FkbM family methyltransferase